jgi:hypothetical protein
LIRPVNPYIGSSRRSFAKDTRGGRARSPPKLLVTTKIGSASV